MPLYRQMDVIPSTSLFTSWHEFQSFAFSQIYQCTNRHVIYAQPSMSEIYKNVSFNMWHSNGFMQIFWDHIDHLVCHGLSMQDCEKNYKKQSKVTLSKFRYVFSR